MTKYNIKSKSEIDKNEFKMLIIKLCWRNIPQTNQEIFNIFKIIWICLSIYTN